MLREPAQLRQLPRILHARLLHAVFDLLPRVRRTVTAQPVPTTTRCPAISPQLTARVFRLPLTDDPSFQTLAESCAALPPLTGPPPPSGLWVEPTEGNGDVQHFVAPCTAETEACDLDSFCNHFTR